MNVRAIALAIPLVLGAACTHGGSQAGHTGTQTGAQASGQEGDQNAPQAGSGAQQQPGADTQQQAGSGAQQQAESGAPASGSPAQDPIMEPGPSIKAHASDQIVNGVIAEVSEDSVAIESEQGDTKTLTVVPQTTIQVDGEEASFDDLEEGQPVRASFNQVEGEDVAVEIRAGDTSSGTAGVDSGGPADAAGSVGGADMGAGASPGSSGGSTGSGGSDSTGTAPR
jgi:hypothetical protein